MSDKLKIAIVDDSSIARESLSYMLQGEPYTPILMESGKELLDFLDHTVPDIILLDIVMPEMDGIETCKLVKKKLGAAYVPILFVSSLSDHEFLIRGLEAGAEDFITKPITSTELQARLRTVSRLKRQYDHLQTMLKLREDMAQMIVHDMRTPLFTIQLYSDMMVQRGMLTHKDDIRAAEAINSQVLRLDTFLSDLLTVTQQADAQLQLKTQPEEINELITEIVKNYQQRADAEKRPLQLNLLTEPYHYRLDAKLFQRLIDNLLVNAFNFSPAGSPITIDVDLTTSENGQTSNNNLKITVKDEGSGVSEADRERIFNQYEIAKVENVKRRQIGLGLAFCRLVVEAHGGTIFVTDNDPQGACFVINLPSY